VDYERLVELGAFEGERVEFLYGTIVEMSPHGPPHDSAIEELTEILVTALVGRARVRVQSAFAASDGSEPEPDVAVVPPGDYHRVHPTEAWLIVEVAETSLKKDRGLKAQLYAESGVPEYWVVNIPDQMVEVHTDIVGGAYTRITPYRSGDTITPKRFPDVKIPVAGVIR
jgi:Uma2 family endonuclease